MVDVEQLRLEVYGSFARTGQAPTLGRLTASSGASADEVAEGLRELARGRHLVLDAAGQSILMAHPFSAVPLGFVVMGATTLWWGGCAWDSFAIPHLVPGADGALVATRCPTCSSPHAWNVRRDAPPPGDQVAHFLVPAARMWDDVVHTCANQRIFCSVECVRALHRDTGYLTDLEHLWRLAAHWYDGRLQSGYQRRDPADAADYLTSVGMTGPFWSH